MRVVITGADGFIGRHLVLRLRELGGFSVSEVRRATTHAELVESITSADAVVHLAGVNRPADPAEFLAVNRDFTASVCRLIRQSNRSPVLVLASSVHAVRDSDYGRSKLFAEDAVKELAGVVRLPVVIFRFPNVFGKWCRPDYNSFVATFCRNVASNMPVRIDDPASPVTLAYIDDVVDSLVDAVKARRPSGVYYANVSPEYETTVGAVADQIRGSRRAIYYVGGWRWFGARASLVLDVC